MKKVFAGFALALVLTGCSAPAPGAPAASESALIASESATSKPAEDSGSNDLTATVKTLAEKNGSVVTKATEEEPGRISVETTLVDPRGGEDSPAAKQALAICEVLAAKTDVTYVSVKEADGTNWVLFGHPKVPKGACGEV